jgi:peptide/nickel transport system permease protein
MDHGEAGVVTPSTAGRSEALLAPRPLGRFVDSDVWHSFTHSPVAMTAAFVAAVCVICALLANVIAPL